MHNQRVAIIGGSSGIGAATASLLHDMGAELILGGRNAERLETSAASIGGAQTVVVDATKQSSVEEFFEAVGPIDHLVVSIAGSRSGQGPVESLNAEELLAVFSEKSVAQILVASTAARSMNPEGSIVLVGGMTARVAAPHIVALAASNGALETSIRPLARELAPLRINAVSPGVVETEWWSRVPAEVRDVTLAQMANQTPVGRNGASVDVGKAIVALLDNTFLTGVVLPVDGGLSLI